MPITDTAELTIQERGMLAVGAATYCQEFSMPDYQLLNGRYDAPVPSTKAREYDSRGKRYLILWQDHGGAIPKWFDQVMQGFVDLLTLPTNWDSYGAESIDRATVRRAFDFVNGFLFYASPAPRVIPLSSGGLQLEWHRKGVDLEVIFDQDDEPMFYYRSAAGEESEYTLREEIHLLVSIIKNLE